MHECVVYIPDSATSAMSLPCTCAMCPRIENIMKPAKILVPLFVMANKIESLKENTYETEINLKEPDSTQIKLKETHGGKERETQ